MKIVIGVTVKMVMVLFIFISFFETLVDRISTGKKDACAKIEMIKV